MSEPAMVIENEEKGSGDGPKLEQSSRPSEALQLTKTQRVLVEMLTEDCGTHFLDSGSAYGRHWQLNQGRTFINEPTTILKFGVYGGKLDVSMIHNVFHWLDDRFEYEETLDEIFHGQFLKDADCPKKVPLRLGTPDPHYCSTEKSWEELAGEFPEWLAKHVTTEGKVRMTEAPKRPRRPVVCSLRGKTRTARKAARERFANAMAKYGKAYAEYERLMEGREDDRFCEVSGIYGEGDPIGINTYNHEELLSQILQYVYFEWDNEAYIILQIHGGCDVRGGYTKPRIFRDCGETSIFEVARGMIGCTGKDHHPAALQLKEFQERQLALPGIHIETIDFDNCRANWYTDDGCNWYEDGTCGRGYTNLEDREAVDLDAEIAEAEEAEADDNVQQNAARQPSGADVIPMPGICHPKDAGAIAPYVRKPGDWRPGVVCVQDGKAYCPDCGALLDGGP